MFRNLGKKYLDVCNICAFWEIVSSVKTNICTGRCIVLIQYVDVYKRQVQHPALLQAFFLNVVFTKKASTTWKVYWFSFVISIYMLTKHQRLYNLPYNFR